MIRIIHYRNKCIGCNVCVEIAFNRWRISKKDGKSVLIGATEKKGFYSVIVGNEELPENTEAASKCPVKVIQVLKI